MIKKSEEDVQRDVAARVIYSYTCIPNNSTRDLDEFLCTCEWDNGAIRGERAPPCN